MTAGGGRSWPSRSADYGADYCRPRFYFCRWIISRDRAGPVYKFSNGINGTVAATITGCADYLLLSFSASSQLWFPLRCTGAKQLRGPCIRTSHARARKYSESWKTGSPSFPEVLMHRCNPGLNSRRQNRPSGALRVVIHQVASTHHAKHCVNACSASTPPHGIGLRNG